MKKKIWILSIGAAVLLVLAFFPTIGSEPVDENLMIGSGTSNEMMGNPGTATISVYYFKEDGTCEKTFKELTLAEREALIDELMQVAGSDLSLKDKFEEELRIFKEYELVSSDITLEDIVDVEAIEGAYGIVSGENFEAHNAPIFFAGAGFGIGIGLPFPITFGKFITALAGLGYVFCLDILEATLYTLQMFLFPVLIGFLNGFMGLLLFGVVPGVFYSNFIGLGMVTQTIWVQLLGGGNRSGGVQETIASFDMSNYDISSDEYQLLAPLIEEYISSSNTD